MELEMWMVEGAHHVIQRPNGMGASRQSLGGLRHTHNKIGYSTMQSCMNNTLCSRQSIVSWLGEIGNLWDGSHVGRAPSGEAAIQPQFCTTQQRVTT